MHSYVSPRTRAQRTLELLDLGCRSRYPWHDSTAPSTSALDIRTNASIEITAAVREWDYGDYEGKVSKDIRADREARGLGGDWDIWRDGCEGGESPEDVAGRLDKFIEELRGKWHKGALPPTVLFPWLCFPFNTCLLPSGRDWY